MFGNFIYYSIALYEFYNVVNFVLIEKRQREKVERLVKSGEGGLVRVGNNTSNLKVYNNSTIVYDRYSQNMYDYVFKRYIVFLQGIPSDSIFILQYPVFSLYNLLFSRRFFLFYPPHTNYIHVVNNLWVYRVIVTCISLYNFPIELDMFLGCLYSFVAWWIV
jgi:hypothetical protein